MSERDDEVTAAEQVGEPVRPMLRVIDQNASDQEIAAIVAALGSSPEEQAARLSPSHPAWGNRSMLAQRAARRGPDGWRRSSQPG